MPFLQEWEICGEDCPTTGRQHLQFVIIADKSTRISSFFAAIKKTRGVHNCELSDVFDLENALLYHRQGKDGGPKEGSHENIWSTLKDETVKGLQDCPRYKGARGGNEAKKQKYEEQAEIRLERMTKRIALACERAKTMVTAIELLHEFPDISNADRAEIWKHRIYVPKKRIQEDTLFDWQRKVVKVVEDRRILMEKGSLDPDVRRVTWIYDLEGGKGKSELASYMEADYAENDINCVVMTLNNKNTTDWEFMTTRGNPKVVIINIPRCIEGDKIPYYIIENLLDGRVQSSKYQGSETIDKVTVLVLANMLPDLSTMTKNRWDIIDLSKPFVTPDFTAQLAQRNITVD
jgi:hypothetical protein